METTMKRPRGREQKYFFDRLTKIGQSISFELDERMKKRKKQRNQLQAAASIHGKKDGKKYSVIVEDNIARVTLKDYVNGN
jgi:hypothetical protein